MFALNSVHEVHELFVTPSGKIYMVDVADTWDCGWEGAYAEFDAEVFNEWWHDWYEMGCDDDERTEPTLDDIFECGEDAGAFADWVVVSTHHRKPEPAIRNLEKALKKLP